ncbi:MAG: hypothetical protein L0287_18185 [Anaerolineae bacterium]|nr:hypothetical protein [Anaerolineae bacterium]MCI0697509.1 hypothetical protein [candidate division KSB1 bacterium]
MPHRMVTVALPDALYERARETAATASISLEQALTQFIALSLPALEDDLSAETRSELAALPLMSDAELWQIANGMMSEEQQNQLESFAEQKKSSPLTAAEQAMLTHLMEQAQHLMLRKAEAYRLLARRGYKVFPSSGTLSD